LRRDLGVLRDGDVREVAARLQRPFSHRTECDSLLTLAVRESVFAGASGVMCRTHPTAGDMLPCDEPASGNPHRRRHAGVTSHRESVARAFAGAQDYDGHARVQREVAQNLARPIAALPIPAEPRVLEIGCGTGFLTEALREQGLGGQLAGHRSGPCDAGAGASAAPDPLGRWRRWLAPGGQIMVATLGPGTFEQWRAAHETEGLVPGTLPFTTPAALEALGPAELIVEHHHERHSDARAFLRAVRSIGADTAAPGYKPLSPLALRRVMRRFEAEGAVATYEV
jgi:malonyl-CoA O-methyltransferase